MRITRDIMQPYWSLILLMTVGEMVLRLSKEVSKYVWVWRGEGRGGLFRPLSYHYSNSLDMGSSPDRLFTTSIHETARAPARTNSMIRPTVPAPSLTLGMHNFQYQSIDRATPLSRAMSTIRNQRGRPDDADLEMRYPLHVG